ncbi:MAG: tail fiber domain-containing protein [Myxococcaceae bacterium]
MKKRLAIAALVLAACTVKPEPRPVDERQLLQKVAQLPISTWSYQWQPERRHLGPMAQDFHAAFGLGDSERTYDPRDADAVTLASLKALSQLADEQDRRIATLEAQNAALRARLAVAK